MNILTGLEFIKDVLRVYIDDQGKLRHMTSLVDKAIKALAPMRFYEYGTGDEPPVNRHYFLYQRHFFYESVETPGVIAWVEHCAGVIFVSYGTRHRPWSFGKELLYGAIEIPRREKFMDGM